jgi:hypothetical protein
VYFRIIHSIGNAFTAGQESGTPFLKNEFFAHSKEGKPPEEWHRLEDHLIRVAKMPAEFASESGAGDCE